MKSRSGRTSFGELVGTSETDWFQAEQETGSDAPDGVLSKVAREVGSALGHAVAFVADLEPRKREPS